jgi:hypothetical protein
VDVDSDLSPGVGYDYFWTPTATNGTWAQNSGGTLPSGAYEPVQPFTNLLGCPMNGDWIIEICDLWASDNGYIFDWNVHFADYMYPDWTTFTPSIGAGCDSSYWTAPSGSIISDPLNMCDTLGVTQAAPGSYVYTYHVIDDHGCEYTEDITVNFYQAPQIELGPNIPYCDGADLDGSVIGGQVPGVSYVYNWTNASLLSASNVPMVQVEPIDTLTQFSMTVVSGNDVACFATDSVQVFIVNAPPRWLYNDTLCAGDPLVLSAPLSSNYNYHWFYSENGAHITIEGSEYQYSIPSVFNQTYFVEITEIVCGKVDTCTFIVSAPDCQLIFPNLLTGYEGDGSQSALCQGDPNAQGNNYFYICGLFGAQGDITGSTLQVFNRWGDKVYESLDYKNDWSPSDLNDGVYYYILKWNRPNPEYFHGDFTLVRE